MMVVALLAWRTSSMNDASEAAISGMASLEANGAGRSEEAAIYTAPPATAERAGERPVSSACVSCSSATNASSAR